jgi:tetratricopeptide (TPR) repeat protein
LLRERLAEVHAQAPGDSMSSSAMVEPDSLMPQDNAFDIAASLDALDDLDEPLDAPTMASPDQEVDVDQVFAKFKEGVKSVVDDSDSATHYDLGLAYKEMGLLDDAISEFELASNDEARACMCFAMMGIIHRDKGELEKARDAFQQGLEAQKTPEQNNSVEYELALVYEAQGKQADYVRHLQRIASRDSNYRDVAARIRALGEKMPEQNDDDEDFEAAFENLIGG